MLSFSFAKSTRNVPSLRGLRQRGASRSTSPHARPCPRSGVLHPGHVRAQNRVHPGLVPGAARTEPVEHILIDTQGDCFLRRRNYRRVVPEVRWQVLQVGGRRGSDLRIGHRPDAFDVGAVPSWSGRFSLPMPPPGSYAHGDLLPHSCARPTRTARESIQKCIQTRRQPRRWRGGSRFSNCPVPRRGVRCSGWARVSISARL